MMTKKIQGCLGANRRDQLFPVWWRKESNLHNRGRLARKKRASSQTGCYCGYHLLKGENGVPGVLTRICSRIAASSAMRQAGERIATFICGSKTDRREELQLIIDRRRYSKAA